MVPPSKRKRAVRRVIIRKKKIPTLSDLVAEAGERGMTVKELLDWYNSMNKTPEQKARRRNKSSSYDMGPMPFRGEDLRSE